MSARLACFLAFLVISAVPALAQTHRVQYPVYTVNYKCNPGRYTIKFAGEPRHYCFDKVHYWEKEVPADVREFFVNLRQEQAAKDAEFDAAMAEHDRHFSKSPTTSAISTPSYASAAVAPAPPRAPARKVSADRLRAIAVGIKGSEVVAKLGQPAGRMSGLSNSGEHWTYLLDDGGSAKVKLENGQVTAVVLPQ